MGMALSVFSNRIEYKRLWGFGGTTTILADRITSVNDPMPGVQKLVVETTGGERHDLVVRLRDKEAARTAILETITKRS